ncbi:dihydroneopterin aldolase [Planktotalea sp.]|uniref:dihydroneopterin aldolase n=1 Tax=Planktotalea sp. TaxID=2029877 RepID=UPI003D6BC796
MSSEISLAFAHPEERSLASATDPMLDRISLRDHIVSVEIGAFQLEREITQRLKFNIVVEVRQISEDLRDDVDLILSYDRVTEAIDIELAAERLNLLETLAERIADRILIEPQAERVFIRIEKLDRGGGALGVEIMRAAQEVEQAPDSDIASAPNCVFLSDEAAKSEYLSSWLEQLTAQGAPLVLCVSAKSDGAAVSCETMAERRIALLAIEQAAWALAARQPSCAVVGTRTELDWSMKNGQTCVWAPSKLVLDGVGGPLDRIGDAVLLSEWLAFELGARALWVIGSEAPRDARMPVHAIRLEQENL